MTRLTSNSGAIATRNSDVQEWLWAEMVIERARQDEKWGEQNHPDEYWLGIVMEEIGEVAKAVIEADDKSLTSEVIHSVAVLCGWMESRNRRALGTVVTA